MCHQELQTEVCSYCGNKKGTQMVTIYCPKNPYHDPTAVRYYPGVGDGGRSRERTITYICEKCER